MEKYDLVSVPVVDYQKKLVGRITLDDVVEYIKDGADKDFQFLQNFTVYFNQIATSLNEPHLSMCPRSKPVEICCQCR